MNIIEKFLELFRKKEFYPLKYSDLNCYSITFKEIVKEDLEKIKSILLDFEDSESISDKKANLVKDSALKFSNIDELLLQIKETIAEDYKKTYFEAVQKKWDFNYFVTDYKPVYKGSIFICNRLLSVVNTDMGEVMYPLLALRKFGGTYYFWSFIEK